MKQPLKAVPEQPTENLLDYTVIPSPHYVMFKDQERPISLSKASWASLPSRTIPSILQECAVKRKDKVMYACEWPEPPLDKTKTNLKEQPAPPLALEEWSTWTYSEAHDEVRQVAKGYIALGFQPRDTVSILAFNSPFWAISALAGIYAGGINNGMYATDSEEQIVYKVLNSETSIVLVDSVVNFDKFAKFIDRMPTIKAIIFFRDFENLSEDKKEKIVRKDGTEVKVMSFETLKKLGERVEDEVIEERLKNQKPGTCCTLVFTSGTTGNPKAVMLSHDNIYFQSLVAKDIMPPAFLTEPQRFLSYLPLSHIAGFLLDVISPLATPLYSEFRSYCSVYFARSYDLKCGSLLHRLLTVRPNIFFGVPRVWEKFQEAIKEKAPKGKVAKTISSFAKRTQFKYQQSLQLGHRIKKPLGLGLSTKLLSKIHKKLGLDKCLFAFSGAAPMKQETLEYWASLGIYISEVYGMSENCGAEACGTLDYRMFGTVGPQASCTEFKVFRKEEGESGKHELIECPRAESLAKGMISEECQGELCYRGRHIMLGYLANKNMGEKHVEELRQKNEEAIDEFGWLHSGDKGFVTKEGMIKVTGRYKELIIGAGGENISPIPIEDFFKQVCPIISNVIMVGDKRKYNVCLITLKVEGATGEVPGTNVLAGAAKEIGGKLVPKVTTVEEAMRSEEFVKYIESKLKETNANGDVILNNTFKIQKFSILPVDFSIQTAELTATMKLKRSVVEKKYANLLDKLYASDEVYVPFN